MDYTASSQWITFDGTLPTSVLLTTVEGKKITIINSQPRGKGANQRRG